jgi:iron complex outermembrane receptor protein
LRTFRRFSGIFLTLSAFSAAQAGGLGEPQTAKASCLRQSDKLSETVVVTGTFSPTPLGEMDRSISLIETDAPLLYDHWVDYLETDSSIDLRRRAPNGVQSDLSLRGSSFGETLILVDGFRMDDAQSGHHDLDLPLPSDSLERIEVLRGAGSTLYGSDAIGGAVNFITAHPAKSGFRLRAGVGNFGINQEGGSLSLAGQRWDQQLSVARDFSTGFMADRDYRSLTMLSSTGVKTRLGETLLLFAYGDKPYGANQFYGDFNSWERTKSWFAALKQDVGTKTEIDLAYRRHSDVFILIRDHPEVYENNHVTESWQAGLRRKAPLQRNMTLFYGGEGNHETIDSSNLGTHDRNRGAVYVDLDIRELRRFSLSLGAREEIFSGKGAQFSPTLGAGFWLKRDLRIRASVGRAYRLPSYTDLFYHDPATSGNPNLRPESAWSYEAGLQWYPSGKIQAQATIFENRERNVIDYVKFFTTDINHAANIQTLNFTGVESSLKAHLTDRQTLDASYTWIHGTQQALSGFASSKYVFNYPINNAVIGWQGQLRGDILARTRVGVVERFGRMTYGVWDADVGRYFGNIGVRFSLSNLTDTSYQEVSGVNAPGCTAVFGLEYVIRSKH